MIKSARFLGITTVAACLLTGAVVGQPLSGAYTIGPSGTYPDMAAAVNALASNGVGGPTTVSVLANDTSGPWTIGAISGQGAANPVVFDGLGSATLSGGSPMLTLSGCSDVTFTGFAANFTSNAIGVTIASGTTNCVFTACSFVAPATTSSGGRIFDLAGGTGCRIEDSTFGGTYEAFYSAAANDTTTIQRCRITGGGWWIARIAGSNFSLLNNFITGSSNYGLSCGVSGSSSSGAGLRVQHNSFHIVHNAGGNQYCSLRWYSNLANTQVQDNVFANIHPPGASSSNYIMWCSGSRRPVVMDYNAFWLPTGAFLIYASTNLTLLGWQALGWDLNSIEADPLYLAPTATPPDLSLTPGSPCLEIGTTIPSVMIDIFGSPRIPPVDIGAHEYTSPNRLSMVTGGGGLGDLSLSLTHIDPLATEGYLLLSFTTAAPLGSGPVFGLHPDALTWETILTPLAPGNLVHFPVGIAGLFPDVPFTAPAGAFSPLGGLVMDGVVVVLGAGFSFLGQSRILRVAW